MDATQSKQETTPKPAKAKGQARADPKPKRAKAVAKKGKAKRSQPRQSQTDDVFGGLLTSGEAEDALEEVLSSGELGG